MAVQNLVDCVKILNGALCEFRKRIYNNWKTERQHMEMLLDIQQIFHGKLDIF